MTQSDKDRFDFLAAGSKPNQTWSGRAAKSKAASKGKERWNLLRGNVQSMVVQAGSLISRDAKLCLGHQVALQLFTIWGQ